MPVGCRPDRRRVVIEISVRRCSALPPRVFSNSSANGPSDALDAAPSGWYRSMLFERPRLFILVTLILCGAAAVAFILVSPKKHTASAITMLASIADKPEPAPTRRRIRARGAWPALSCSAGRRRRRNSTGSCRRWPAPRWPNACCRTRSSSRPSSPRMGPRDRSWVPLREGRLRAVPEAQVAKAAGLPPPAPRPAPTGSGTPRRGQHQHEGRRPATPRSSPYDHTDPQAALVAVLGAPSSPTTTRSNREQIVNQSRHADQPRINALLSSTTDLTMRAIRRIPLLVEQRRRQLAGAGRYALRHRRDRPRRRYRCSPASPKPLLLLVIIGVFAISRRLRRADLPHHTARAWGPGQRSQ